MMQLAPLPLTHAWDQTSVSLGIVVPQVIQQYTIPAENIAKIKVSRVPRACVQINLKEAVHLRVIFLACVPVLCGCMR